MRVDENTYEKVAENCSEFLPVEKAAAYSNSQSQERNVSCMYCEHFAEDEHCVLDLYDKIVKNI